MELYRYSSELIKRHQAPSGAFVAAPAFSKYQYCWLRDGTWLAYSMDLAGEVEAAEKFYRWVDRTIRKQAAKIDTLIEQKRRGERPTPEQFLHTRFTVEGEAGSEPWGNHQLDGYGMYLWGFAEHLKRRAGADILRAEFAPSLRATGAYLLEFWSEPCFDCWEERGDQVHPSTLAAIYGGLRALAELFPDLDLQIEPACRKMRELVERSGVVEGRFIKSLGDLRIDANLLSLAVPFAMFAPTDLRMVRTVAAVEAELCTGGVHRYRDDSFYGGGAWPLLTAWLGWYHLQRGDVKRASDLLTWVEAQVDEGGNLPEQVPEGLFVPTEHQRWIERWGQPAKPLLWSHAMYVVLKSQFMIN